MAQFLEIHHHYASARSRALSYLMTVGAKALVLATTKDQALVYRGLDEELAARRDMILEEQARHLRRKLSGKPGVEVYKRARNGEIRKIDIKIRNLNGADCIQWRSKSFPYRKRSFVLDSSMEAHYISNDAKLGSSASGRPSVQDMPYVRIKSDGRDLDLAFDAVGGAESFCFMLTSQFIKRANADYCPG